MNWIVGLIKSAFQTIISGFSFGEKRQSKKIAEIPMREKEHDEEVNIRKVENETKEEKAIIDLIKAHDKRKEIEYKFNVEVIEDENGDLEIIEIEEDELLEIAKSLNKGKGRKLRKAYYRLKDYQARTNLNDEDLQKIEDLKKRFIEVMPKLEKQRLRDRRKNN